MKISFILDSFGGGGKERRCLQLIQGLNSRGYTSIQVIIINNDIAYKELYDTNINLHIINRKNLGLNIIQTTLRIYRLLRDFNPDIVQVWGIFSAFFINPIRCFMRFRYISAYVANCNKPITCSVEGIIVFVNTFIADSIVGNSLAGIIAYGIPKKKAKVIYNGFNEERYNSLVPSIDEIKNQLNISTEKVVSMVARIDENKDHKTFILAAKKIIKERKDIVFLIIGEGSNLHRVKSLILSNERKYFRFLGFRPDVESFLRISDISVLCTNPLKHKEGVSNAIMESLAFGVPVIATNDGGTPEIVNDCHNGYLINSFDINELCQKINLILDDEYLHASLSKCAVETVRDKFTLNIMVNHYIELYNLILKS